jgi:hypothetical protein
MNLATAQKLSQRVMNGKGLISKDVDIHLGVDRGWNVFPLFDEDGDPIPVTMSQENREID